MKALLGIGIICLLLILPACKKTSPQTPAPPASPAVTAFEHKMLTDLLAAYVDKDGFVNYSGLKADRGKLDQYLATLATAQPNNFPNEAEKLAFWINTYNATTLAAALDDVVGKAKSVKDVKGFFDQKKHKVAGEELTLDEIEKRGRDLKDPRIHFAINCASISCPKLQQRAFTGDALEPQLQKAATEFLGEAGRGMRYTDSSNTVFLSPIFKWYAADFTGTNAVAARVKAEVSGEELLAAAIRYVPPDVALFLRQKKPSVQYLEYNWQLNSQVTSATPISSPK